MYLIATASLSLTSKIFVPSLSLALEYQGEPHYKYLPVYGSPANKQINDQRKLELSKELGITLIQIPYWWDMKLPSLSATLQFFRPDILFIL
jgi:hypothetical protein